jgi:hypothetical protein
MTTGASLAQPARDILCTLMHFTKSAVDKPPRAAAPPPVGSTWFVPVA